MEYICSLQRLNFTRKILHRMDYLVLRLSLSSLMQIDDLFLVYKFILDVGTI